MGTTETLQNVQIRTQQTLQSRPPYNIIDQQLFIVPGFFITIKIMHFKEKFLNFSTEIEIIFHLWLCGCYREQRHNCFQETKVSCQRSMKEATFPQNLWYSYRVRKGHTSHSEDEHSVPKYWPRPAERLFYAWIKRNKLGLILMREKAQYLFSKYIKVCQTFKIILLLFS